MKLYHKLNGYEWTDSQDFRGQHFPPKVRNTIRQTRKKMTRKIRRFLDRELQKDLKEAVN